MDADRFDRLSKTLSTTGSRRTLLQLLTALPLAGALAALLGEASAAKGRREKRKDRHRQNQNKRQQRRRHEQQRKHDKHNHRQQRRQKRKKCTPASLAETCAGKCATVLDNCGSAIDCGDCACGTCPLCQTCNPATGACIPNPATAGGACGTGRRCVDGECVCDSTSCATGCCAGAGTCHIDDNDACGTNGGSCIPCTAPQTCGGGGTAGLCGDPPPVIDSFTATPATIDRGATTPEESTLTWSTSNATTCSIDNGVGSVDCNGNTTVGPSDTTTYTLSASGPGGGPVTDQETVTVEYCHAITSSGIGGPCPAASQYCASHPIVATSSADAHGACDACFGSGTCESGTTETGANSWTHADSLTSYTYSNATSTCIGVTSTAGAITTETGCTSLGRWAP